MSNTDWNASNLSTVAAESVPPGSPGCQADDLKELLSAIVHQISEADRRQADTLSQLQDRLANMGRDARSLRDKIPDKYQSAFERIEAGMVELAARIAEAGTMPSGSTSAIHADRWHEPHTIAPTASFAQTHAFTPVPATASAAALDDEHQSAREQQPMAHNPDSPNASEPPVALRSAHTGPAGWRRDESGHKTASNVDTFDVIESLPGDVADPWDSEAATALASVYESDSQTFPQASDPAPAGETPRVYAPAGAPPPQAGFDHTWLEQRLAEISERIETSIADIRPDQSFFALGQRLDQFELSVTQAFENVASRTDVESIRHIEAHMIEVVEHLESSHLQLTRIESIEAQLAAISGRLDEVHALASASEAGYGSESGASSTRLDVSAIVKAAADETAMRLSEFAQHAGDVSGIQDIRGLLEESISNARQSEENTNALLDTLQQAMIRLLDRMDAVEFNQHQAASQTMSPPGFKPAAKRSFHDEATRSLNTMNSGPEFEDAQAYPSTELDPIGLDEAVAAVAASKSTSAPYLPATIDDDEHPAANNGPCTPEKLRQDFIADARRAKMRLAAEAGDGDTILAADPRESIAAPPVKPARTSKPATTTLAAEPKKPSAISPRVVALSVALAIASAAYLLNPFGKSAGPMGNPGAMMNQTSAPTAGTAVGKSSNDPREPATTGSATEAPPPDADFGKPDKPAQLNLHQMDGQIDNGSAPSMSRPMSGVALAHPATSADEIERARRDHAIANISTRLGQIAAENPAVVSPAALDLAAPLQRAEPADSSSQHRSALDMPPAMVGPLSLRLAAANGDPSAEFEVGARIAEGKGPDQNFKEAAKWYMRSASKGFAQAQYRLGTLYERGLGMRVDEARAKEWYARAAGQGNIKAMHNLAVLSANGKTGSPDYAVAARWFKEAAARGLADSQFNLAVLYENGLGVPVNMREAYKWLSLAARGDKEAVRRRDIMKGKLTAAELSEARKMTNSFRPLPSDPLVNDARTAGEAWKKNSSDQS